MESSETKEESKSEGPRVLLFILNRNGLEEDDIRNVISIIADTQFGAPDIEVLWVSILGKLPDRPHALITLSDDDVAREIAGQTLTLRYGDKDCILEISEAFGTDAKEENNDDPHTIFVTNVPIKMTEADLSGELSDFFAAVARPTKVIFPRNWIETRSVLITFDNIEAAKMVMKTAFICTFKDKLMRCSYARKREARQTSTRPPPSAPRNNVKPVKKAVKKPKVQRDYFMEAKSRK